MVTARYVCVRVGALGVGGGVGDVRGWGVGGFMCLWSLGGPTRHATVRTLDMVNVWASTLGCGWARGQRRAARCREAGLFFFQCLTLTLTAHTNTRSQRSLCIHTLAPRICCRDRALAQASRRRHRARHDGPTPLTGRGPTSVVRTDMPADSSGGLGFWGGLWGGGDRGDRDRAGAPSPSTVPPLLSLAELKRAHEILMVRAVYVGGCVLRAW